MNGKLIEVTAFARVQQPASCSAEGGVDLVAGAGSRGESGVAVGFEGVAEDGEGGEERGGISGLRRIERFLNGVVVRDLTRVGFVAQLWVHPLRALI